MADTRFKLNTGAEIPALGLGTWQSAAGEVKNAVSDALSLGYRHIDAAYCYGNEDEVGAGLKKAFDSGIKREDVFVTTKLWSTYHSRVEENLDMSLKSLGLDYVDLYLVHWPVAMNPNGNHEKFPKHPDGSRDLVKDWSHIQTWKLMEKLVATGKVKAIGVANYSVRFLQELLPQATIVPAVNQIENHPSLPQQEIVDFCKSKGIHITAYSPLGSTGSPMFTAAPVVEVAKKRSVTPAVVLLSYHIARGSSVLAKSVNPERIKANMELIKLDDTDMKVLNDYSRDLESSGKVVRYVYPAFGVDFGFPDKS
ncbi:putative aldehyde reductase [Venustampulla echinocandica]|uniref:Putative aldehyde reductase n=1 Tax=Venustampulla echinocandica TaxID=2656787 RepID=A0A370TKX1_9HELO|nr:putative aldehyde reductase [Venustampulla echinocandica]RDL36176.1 putative aldehyde reductase [Venustampulla echinocandica]